MQETILNRLSEIESLETVKVLYACESGSRAWGFPSSDSDYDVRFIYIRPRDWYLSINLEHKRDVIEQPISDMLDITGWDLRKALKLFYKSNPPLLEWLGSPIVYLDGENSIAQMRELAKTFYSPKACMYHYLHMAQRTYRDYLKGDIVRIKKYFYTLRPILAINWLEQARGIVPTEFSVLVGAIVPKGQLKNDINDLIEKKRKGIELDEGPKIVSISNFLDDEIARLSNKKFHGSPLPALETKGEFKRPPIDALDKLFQKALDFE